MASPSPYYSSANDQSSLFVSESPSPQRQRPQHPNQWNSRPGAPLRNPSFTLPPLIPSLLNNNRSPIEGNPYAVYGNQGQNTWNYFSGASGGNPNANAASNSANSRQPQHQRQNHPNPQPQVNEQPQRRDDYFYIPSVTPPVRQQEREEEPRLPTPQPQPPQQNQGQLTPTRFELPDGENYLTSTPDGGWNIADYSDAFDPGQFNDPSNYNGNLDQEDPFNFNWRSNQDNAELEPRVLDQEGQRQLYQDPNTQARDREEQILQGEQQNRQYDEWEREARESERVQQERRGRALRQIRRVQLERERREREDEVDLTRTSISSIPNMPRGIPGSGPAGRKRTAARAQSSEGNDGGAISPPSTKRTKTNNSSSSQQQSRNNSNNNDAHDDLFGTPSAAEDEVDLVGVENDEDYEAQKEKRKQEEAKRLREEEAAKPVKLAKQQCVICLDHPTGLVVTHCGMFLSYLHLFRPFLPAPEGPPNHPLPSFRFR